ncbi:LuxR family transcriptional regulator [Dokdonella sp.]|uniref:LuxR family transcriptional regulator n=1 Tax=Dokdonella sp. TaxID=2291710 RepID=UPI001B212010|nr:LuxR family transcriptional regulator [Dokdonella sp.]MBO9664469.1 LuxR family transcriptional regulator [Dokdonella sp.]
MQTLLVCDSHEQLHHSGSECARRLGYDAWVYAMMPAGGAEVPYLCGSLPSTWYSDHFKHGHGAADPVFAHCRRHLTPLIWNVENVRDDEDPDCPVFFRDAADIGLRYGVSVPIHGFGCQWGVLALASSQAPPRTAMRRLADAQLFATFVHEAGHRLANAIESEHVRLTERERECLRWTAGGKTGWEISQVLGISERTVVFHLENAARKFGVFGRRQAAARAIALQMISL